MAENKAKFDTVEAAIEDLKKGVPVVLLTMKIEKMKGI